MERILLGAALAALLWSLALQLGPGATLAGLSEQELEAERSSAERARIRQGPDFDEALTRMWAVAAERRRRFAWKGWALAGLGLGALAVWLGRERRTLGPEAEEERLRAFLECEVPPPEVASNAAGAGWLVAAERLGVQPGAAREVVEAACAALLETRPLEEHASLRASQDLLLLSGGSGASLTKRETD